jgi:hypothetical protein
MEESSTLQHDPQGDRIHSPLPLCVDTVDKLNTLLGSAQDYAADTGATRIVVRAVVKEDSLEEMLPAMNKSFVLEATLPLSHKRGTLMFLGWNDPSRMASQALTASQDALLHTIVAKPRQSLEDIFSGLKELPFCMETIVGNVSNQNCDQIIKIHRDSFSAFQDWDAHRVETVLANPDKYFLMAARNREDCRIFCISCMEYNEVPLWENASVRLGEFIYTGRLHTSSAPRGLASLIKLRLAAEASKRGMDVCFGESRAANGGITGTNHRIGMQYAGRLRQHICISGPRDVAPNADSPYEDFGVWYLSQASLQHAASAVKTLQRPGIER